MKTLKESILDPDFDGPEIASKEAIRAFPKIKKIIDRAETGITGAKTYHFDGQEAVNDIYDALEPALKKLPKSKIEQAQDEGKTIIAFDERSWLGMDVRACESGKFDFEYASLIGFEGTAVVFDYSAKGNRYTTYFTKGMKGVYWYTIEDGGMLIKLFKEAAGK